MADLKGQAIRDAYDQLLTKGSANSVEDGDGVGFDISGANISGQTLQTALDGKADEGSVLNYVPEYIPASGAFDSINYNRAFDSKYVKMGSLVIFGATLQTQGFSLGTASGALRISLPPFNVISEGTVNISNAGAFGVWNTYPTSCFISPAANLAVLSTKSSLQSAESSLQVTGLQESGGGSRNFLRFSGWYLTND